MELHLYINESRYKINSIPVITVGELKECKTVYITGEDPLKPPFGNISKQFIHFLRNQYGNIEKLYLCSSGIFFGNETSNEEWRAIYTLRMFGNSNIDGFLWKPESTKDWQGLINFQKDYKHVYLHEGRYYEPMCDNVVPTENKLYILSEQKKNFEEIMWAYPKFTKNLHIHEILEEDSPQIEQTSKRIFRRLPVLFQL